MTTSTLTLSAGEQMILTVLGTPGRMHGVHRVRQTIGRRMTVAAFNLCVLSLIAKGLVWGEALANPKALRPEARRHLVPATVRDGRGRIIQTHYLEIGTRAA